MGARGDIRLEVKGEKADFFVTVMTVAQQKRI